MDCSMGLDGMGGDSSCPVLLMRNHCGSEQATNQPAQSKAQLDQNEDVKPQSLLCE